MIEWGLFCIEHQIPKFTLLVAIHDSKLDAGPGLGVTANSEVHINYGNKGNEELLYLYGFVMDTNPNDYLMV
jgi:hypothetical protein